MLDDCLLDFIPVTIQLDDCPESQERSPKTSGPRDPDDALTLDHGTSAAYKLSSAYEQLG